MLRDLFSLIFPRQCPGCNQTLSRKEGEVCLNCITEIPLTNSHRFPTDNELYLRLAGKVELEGAISMYYFDKHGKAKRIIQALKYKNRPELGKYLGEEWGTNLVGNGLYGDIDKLVPVPLHVKKLRTRGYNQAERIAVGLGKTLGIPVDSKSLIRVLDSETQTRMGKDDRWDNVKDVFALKRPIEGHIGLVDDVATTGSTLEACIRTMASGGAENLRVTVFSLCLARNG